MVDAVLLELEGVVFDTHELRRIALQDALLDRGLASTVDHDQLHGFGPRAAAAAALAKQGVAQDEVLLDLVALSAEREQGVLSVDRLRELMADAQVAAYGDGLDPRDRHPDMWAVKGHYYTAYYNWPYT